MADEKWLISAWDLIEWLRNIELENHHRVLAGKKAKCLNTDGVRHMIDTVPKVDAVPTEAYEQVRWERDVAMRQLEEHGIPFGGIAPDVVKVVRCRDCKHQIERGYAQYRYKWCEVLRRINGMGDDGFCNYGERKDK